MENTDLLKERSINKVAVLGAGASADAGVPTLNQFWHKVQELIKSKQFTNEEIGKINNILEKRKLLLPDSNIEEFFSYVDFQINFDVLIPISAEDRIFINKVTNKHDRGRIPIPNIRHMGKEKADFEKLKNEISWLIIRTLDLSLKSCDNKIEECYTKLIKNFDVTITFNWDTLYERAYKRLMEKSIPEDHLGFCGYIRKKTLLKLHGSLDWGECQQCNGLHMSDKIEHVVYENKICPNCNKSALIITSILPALTKFEKISKTKKPDYKMIWDCAMYAISGAKEIYFFGYSLSDNDVHTKIFFKSGILNNINSELKLYVIDKCCCEDLQNRYRKAFENKTKPIFIEKTFKEFFSRQ